MNPLDTCDDCSEDPCICGLPSGASEAMQDQDPKPLFRKLLHKAREQRREKRRLEYRIADLEASVANENRKAADLDRRLRRVVSAEVTRGPDDIFRLCVNVDRRKADLSYDGAVWEEATRHLIESLRRELARR